MWYFQLLCNLQVSWFFKVLFLKLSFLCLFFMNGTVWYLITRTVEDFDDWTAWLLYKGGVGIKGENSWESWWDEEQVFFLVFLKCLICICALSCGPSNLLHHVIYNIFDYILYPVSLVFRKLIIELELQLVLQH